MNLLSTHSEFCFSNGDHVIKTEDRFKSGRMPPVTSMFQCDTFATTPYLGMMAFDPDDVNSSSPSPDRFPLLYHNNNNNNPQIFLNDNRYFNDVGVASDRNFNLNHSKLSNSLQSSYKSGNTPRKERKRTHNINSAFSALRNCIPNVPSDTKLSKIKTLRLATSYISYLMDVLSKDDPNSCGSFKAEIVKKTDPRHERRKSEVHKTETNNDTKSKKSCKPSRTGWPQQVWAAEFQPEKNESFHNMEQ